MRTSRTHSATLTALACFAVAALAGCHGGGGMHALPASNAGSAHSVSPKTISEASYAAAVLADSPLAYYRLDDTGSTLTDKSPHALTGTYGSAISHNIPSLVPNTVDPSARFPGGAWNANGIATVAPNATLQPSSSVSVEAWIWEQNISSTRVDVVSYADQTVGLPYALSVLSNNTLQFKIQTTTNAVYTALSSTVVTPGAAYHVVGTYDGATIKIYVNGVLESSSTASGTLLYTGATTYGLSIGAAQNSTRNIFSGTLDDVSVYGTGLSATQVANHYAAAQNAPDDLYAYRIMADMPIAYYRLDDAGTVLADATNNRYNGTYGSAVTRRSPGLLPNIADTAAAFPGGAWSSNAIAAVPQSTNLQPASFSTEVLVKPAATNGSGGFIDLVSYGPQSGGQAWSVQLSPSNTFVAYVSTASGSANANGTTVIAFGTPYQVDATYDGGTLKLYVNSHLEGSASISGNVNYASVGNYGLSIGAGQSTARQVFNGTLDEVSYYGSALTAAQVTKHYNVSSASTAQTGPPHIQTWAYYDLSHNAAADLSYMLRHVDWAENASDGSLTDAFRAAGGAHAVQYSDPQMVYYCNSPFGPPAVNTPGSCSLPFGPLGDPTLNGDESAWLHGTGAVAGAQAGARLHTPTSDPQYLYGENLYIHSSHVRNAYSASTGKVANSHSIDAFFMDDSSAHYSPSEYVYIFGTSASEYDSQPNPDGAYNADNVTLTCYAAWPVFFNGPSWDSSDSTNGPQEKADDTAMLQSPCVRGVIIEGAFANGGYRKSLNKYGSHFITIANQALLAQSLQKSPVVLNYASCSYGKPGCTYDPVGDRLYGLGGTWLVYDPRYTIAFNFLDASVDPNMVRVVGGTSYPDSLVAEFSIVPTQPLQTATNLDITTLQVPDGHTFEDSPAGGAFRREFAQCYQTGVSIGHCAVVLNPESNQYTAGGVAPMPSLSQTYTKTLVLNDAPADTTGTATWTTGLPATLQPTTAVILAQ